MDISGTLAPNSDQLDAVDLLGGPQTFTITGVTKGSAEQPVQIALAEFERPWRPGKSMRRVLVAAWGPDASQYVGRKVTLYCDPTVVFGGSPVGGTRISHMTDLKGGKPLSVPLLISRGKSQMFTVQPLKDTAPTKPAGPTAEQIAASTDVTALRGMWQAASPATRKQIEARVAELTATPEPAPDTADVDASWGLAEEGQPS